ncbi:kinase-like domain-containing protein [Dissophora ornata]|nr:kinase-like domain-containing protein [Dissophora ornata]
MTIDNICILQASVTNNTLVTYFLSDGTTTLRTIMTETNALTNDLFVASVSTLWQINPTGVVITAIGEPTNVVGVPSTGGGENTPPASTDPLPPPEHKSQLPVIVGCVVGAIALIAIVAALLVVRRRKSQGGRSVFAKKQKNLFPANADETMVPLGLYHQNMDRGLPEVPRLLENDLERLGYGHQQGNEFANATGPFNKNTNSNNTQLYHGQHSKDGSQPHLDETIPLEAALAHRHHDMHTPQGLTHSISMSSATSKFPRQSAKGGKRFEEKIQLQVIRYDVQDAHLVSPHGPTGRLVLGTYHVISAARSARSIKVQGGVSTGVARSGTVVVRRTRMDLGTGAISPVRALSPLREMAEESSMLLTDAENQHTFEAATLKWYMTELHWKREAALLKHLKSPIFVVELLESYCIPTLQNRAHTYPFVNAMGGCSSLLSDVGPIKSPQHARSILRSISAAVDWCHRHGVVHLNLQPGSFFIEDGIDPKAEDAPWKLWDFTCARFMGEPIGPVGGGGDQTNSVLSSSAPQPPPNHTSPEAYPFLEQQRLEERLDRIGGNPLPAAYTAPELLEAWRAGDTTFPAEAGMDTWSLGCVYYEVLSGGRPLFRTEAEAWALIGGWENGDSWTSKDFRVPSPVAVSDGNTATEGSPSLDPSGSIFKLLNDMMAVHADERVSVETIMERIY